MRKEFPKDSTGTQTLCSVFSHQQQNLLLTPHTFHLLLYNGETQQCQKRTFSKQLSFPKPGTVFLPVAYQR